MGGPDVDEASVGLCVIRTECLPGERRLTVTATPDISRGAELAQHPATAEEALELVARFLAQRCPP